MGKVELPQVRPWLTYAQWKDVYGIYGSRTLPHAPECLLSVSGDLIYIRVLGNPILGRLSTSHLRHIEFTPILVLNTAAAASDLLEKRSGKS
jgi:hypothetical protein